MKGPEAEAPNDQTLSAFRTKWSQNTDLAYAATQDPGSEIHRWILNRNGFADAAVLRAYLAGRPRILDAGCGNGRVLHLLAAHAPAGARLVGVDPTAADAAAENLRSFRNVEVSAHDILGPLDDLGPFDFIYCQEVLHHTPAPEQGFRNLASRLAPGGEIAIYVYGPKPLLRRSADNLLRERIIALHEAEALEVCGQLAELGRVLHQLDGRVQVPDVEIAGIQAGEYTVQRFIYNFFLKCFWNPDLSFAHNAALNFDWYRPAQASTHTLDEILGWFARAGLAVVQSHVDPYGITVRGRCA